MFLGGRGTDPSRAKDLIPILESPVSKEPSTFVYSWQPSIFGRGVGGSRSVDMDISGVHLQDIFEAAQRAGAKIGARLPRAEEQVSDHVRAFSWVNRKFVSHLTGYVLRMRA